MKNLNPTCLGWKYNQSKTGAVMRKKSFLDLMISIIIAFLIIYVITQVLLYLDQSIRFSWLKTDLSMINPFEVQTAHAGSTEAKKIIQSHREINIVKEKGFTFTVGFKNLSDYTWKQKGNGKVEIKIAPPYTRDTIVRHKFWRDSSTPAWLMGDMNKPGWIGYYKFALEAPKESGIFTEKFVLVRNGNEIIPGSEFEITMNVWDSTAQFPQKNSGTVAANKLEVKSTALAEEVKVVVKSQPDPEPVTTPEPQPQSQPTQPQANQDFTLAQKCLDLKGKRFYVSSISNSNLPQERTVNQETINECMTIGIDLTPNIFPYEVDVPTNTNSNTSTNTSTSNSSNSTTNSNSSNSTPAPVVPTPVAPNNDNSGSNGPTMRIGLFYTTEPIRLTANTAYQIKDQNQNVLASVGANVTTNVNFNFSSRTYSYTAGSQSASTSSYLRFESGNANTVFEILSYENRPGWNQSLNDNKFLNIMEVRYSPNTDRLWLINELAMETYLKGLAESSNISPIEYQKALITAARTYAMHHYNRGTKHANEYFTLDARYDQVYKGYGSQVRLPKVSQAVEETKGMVVTYDGEIAITPYFSHSDGHTRDWSEVWGGDIPWCKSVAEPEGYDRDYMYGHGVGMSARGAIFLANDGLTYEEILKYYYTGIEVIKIY